MQTFLPYESFVSTAKVLDYKRLGKQRVEAKQILEILLEGPSKSLSRWKHHPAVLMWEGHEYYLASYGMTMCDEWIRREYTDNLIQYFVDARNEVLSDGSDGMLVPPWIGFKPFHLSHMSNLVRKDPVHYGWQFGPGVPADLPYYWPTKEGWA